MHASLLARRARWFLACAALAAAPILSGCPTGASGEVASASTNGEGGAAGRRGGGGRPEAPAILVRTTKVEARELTKGIRATATLESERHTTLTVQTTGHVVSVLADVGDWVEEGQVLLTLDTARLQFAYDEAALAATEAAQRAHEARLLVKEVEAQHRTALLSRDESEANLARVQELSRKALVSVGDLDAARYNRERMIIAVESAVLGLEKANLTSTIAATLSEKAALVRDRADLDLKQASLAAPFAGVIAVRTVRPGDNLAQGQAVFELSDPTRLVAPVFLPQKNLGVLREDMRIEVRADALPDMIAAGSVRRLPRTVDATTGNVRLDVALAPDAPFLPGMFVTLRLVTERRVGVPTVPKKAIRLDGESAVVFRIDENDVAREVRFTPGLEDQDHVEVTGGALALGDRVVLVGVEHVREGLRVREAIEPGPRPGRGAERDGAERGGAERGGERGSESGESGERSAERRVERPAARGGAAAPSGG